MATILAKHGVSYRLAEGDLVKFSAPLKTEEGDSVTKPGKFTYRWGKYVAFFYDVPKFYPSEEGANLYSPVAQTQTPDPEPEPEPEPEPQPEVILATLVGGESFVQNDHWSVGTNVYAGFGTTKNAPEGFRVQGPTATESGPSTLLRLGMLSTEIPDVDLPMQGRAQEGSIWQINGTRAANLLLHGYYQVPGSFIDPFRWEGMKSGLRVKQKVVLDGKIVRVLITNTNESDSPMDLRYGRVFDPDTGMSYSTTQKVLENGLIEMKLSNGARVLLRAEGASFYRTAYTGAQDFNGTLMTTAQSARKADDTVQAIWPKVTLAPGESKTYVVEYEATAA